MFCVASLFSKVVALASRSANNEAITPAIFTMLDIVLSGNIGSDSLTPCDRPFNYTCIVNY